MAHTRANTEDRGTDRFFADVLCLILRRDRVEERVASRFLLAGITRVRIGRLDPSAGRPAIDRERVGTEVHLILRLDDERASENHCDLVLRPGGWEVEVHKTTNPCRVDGRTVSSRAALHDQSLIECGATFFMLRCDMPWHHDQPPEGRDFTGVKDWETLHLPLVETYREARELAPTRVPLLLRGPTGTGKERLARGVHDLSKRPGELVVVNCASLDPALADSKLFGHRRGAFTGATQSQMGFIEASDRGTLFLDEVGQLPLESQARLLRVVEDGKVFPVGETVGKVFNLRIIAATSSALAPDRFLVDLRMRLGVPPLWLPPLAERREDIGLMLAEVADKSTLAFSPDAITAILLNSWVGAARELVSVVTRLVERGKRKIALDDLPFGLPEPPSLRPARKGAIQPDDVHSALTRAQGKVVDAARLLGVDRQHIYRLCRKFNIDRLAYRPAGTPPEPDDDEP